MANQVLANIHQALSDTQKQWKGVLLIPLLCLIFVSLTLIITPPATGYEYSIYEPYSLVFWIVAGIIFLFPLLYLIVSSTKNSSLSFCKKSIYGLLVIALANLILLFHIQKAHGYVLFSGGEFSAATAENSINLLREAYEECQHISPIREVITIMEHSSMQTNVIYKEILSIPLGCSVRRWEFSIFSPE